MHALNRHGMAGSMGWAGAAGDNAAMESFFALLQKNVLDRRDWDTREQLRIAIMTWIERTYYRRRRQVRLGGSTPIEFETIMNTPAALAARLQPVTQTCGSPQPTSPVSNEVLCDGDDTERISCYSPELDCSRLARIGIDLIFSLLKSFQISPFGRRARRHRITSSGVTIKSTLKS
ncbi:hypothetical protein GCM10027447_37090 [Glycomyces halotolerans]